MFIPSTVVPAVSEASIQAFCAAMNTPVVNIEELDVSPARAAIALCAGEYGDLCLVVLVRSLKSGRFIAFNYQGDPGEFGSPAGALDAALSFSEGMGFIFEEDLIASQGTAGRRRAWKIWRSLKAEDDDDVGADGTAVMALQDELEDDAAEELILEESLLDEAMGDDALELEEAIVETPAGDETRSFVGVLPGADPASEDARAPASPPARVLTKFRRTTASEESGADESIDVRSVPVDAAEVPRSGRAAVADVELEGQPVGSVVDGGSEFLTRLLASF